MTAPNPTPNQPSKALDWAVTAAGVVAILLIGGALVLSYVPKSPANAIQALRYTGFGFLALFALGTVYQNKDLFGEMARRRTTQQGANSLMRTVAILLILGVLNWFGFRHHTRYDLTANHEFSLAEQSKKIARGLNEELKLTAFIRAGDPQGRQLRDLMTEYGFSTDKLKLNLIDPDREPGKVQQFFQAHPGASKRSNVLMIERGDKVFEAQGTTEQEVTAALLKATGSRSFKVYILQGHGEPSLDGYDQDSISQIKDSLQKQNYTVSKLSLFETKSVPADADLLLVPGPRKPLLAQELAAIDAYVGKGGHIFLMFSPGAESGLESKVARWGLKVEKDLVVDRRSNFFGDMAVPVVQTYPAHTITEGLRPTLFPAARSIDVPSQAPAGVTVSPLADSSDDSFGKMDLKDTSPDKKKGVDKDGPLHLGVALALEATGSAKATRAVVFGNAQFITNGFVPQAGNSDLFLNCVNWVTEQDNLVSIPPKNDQKPPLYLTAQQTNTIFLVTVVGAPGAMLLAGGFVWWRRRRS